MTSENQNVANASHISTYILELPFWIGLFLWSLLPGSKTPWFDFASIPINLQDIAVILIAIFYLMLPAIDKRPIVRSHNSWHYGLPILIISVLLYAAFSVSWSGINQRNAMAMLYTLVLTASGFCLGYNLVIKRSFVCVRSFLWRVTVYLSILGLLYSAASLFSVAPGDLRSEVYSGTSEFGILRVTGPLFTSSTGYFILIPALAFAIQELIDSKSQRLFKLIVVFSLMLTTIGLGSRGALIILSIFFLLLIFFIKNKKQAIAAVVVVVFAIATAAGIFFSKANTERLQSMEDSSRTQTYLISFKIMNDRTIEYNIPGSGYGSYWAWYLTDVESFRDSIIINPETFFLSTKFGDILYNPHSTFLVFIIELGMLGLLFFLFLWSVLFRILFHNTHGQKSPIFACGVFASGISMFFDCFIFKYAALSTMWWFFLFCALALNYQAKSVQNI